MLSFSVGLEHIARQIAQSLCLFIYTIIRYVKDERSVVPCTIGHMSLYSRIIRPTLFLIEPELIHDIIIVVGSLMGKVPPLRRLLRTMLAYEHPALETTVCGIEFKNPIGLGAGFDKNLNLIETIPAVGFGGMEVGAITALPCVGNPGRHMVRLPADKSIVVYYGLMNNGAERALPRLTSRSHAIPVGINIAKTNDSSIKGEASLMDYVATYRLLAPHADWATINVSCPNSGDGCTFQEPLMLDMLCEKIEKENKVCPVFLKISSDLSTEEVDSILVVAEKYTFIDGFIVGNLAKDRTKLTLVSPKERLDILPDAGLSGGPMKGLATNLIRHIYQKTKRKYVIIGLGGVFSAEDAYEKIKAGASLIQMVTGLIYGGPQVVGEINKGLVELLKKDGYKNIREAVGAEHRKG